MKLHLQNILHKKIEQLQLAGNLGQRVLHQQSELEERIKQIEDLEIDKDEDDELDQEARQRYQELADTIVAWDEENAQLSTCFGNNAKVRGISYMAPKLALILVSGPLECRSSFSCHDLRRAIS